MITTMELQERISRYRDYCIENHKEPTYHGLANVLQISSPTVKHIVDGTYKDGKYYTDHPHVTRIIANCDFDIVRNLFNREGLGNE